MGPEKRGSRFDGRAEARTAKPSREPANWRGEMVEKLYMAKFMVQNH